MEKWIETDLEKRLAYIKESAWQHAGEQMNIAEMYLRKHPGENVVFDSALAGLHEIEAEMEKKLNLRFADDCRSVYMRYAGTIAMEVYMRGVMDDARLHYPCAAARSWQCHSHPSRW